MCRRGVLLWVLAVMLLLVDGSVAAAQEGGGGAVRQPRTDAERRGGNKERPRFRAKVDRRSLRGDVLGRGKRTDKNRDGRFSADECDWLIRGFLSNRLLELGLICRADDRGDPVIQLSPSLVAGPDEFETISSTIQQVLTEAWKELDR